MEELRFVDLDSDEGHDPSPEMMMKSDVLKIFFTEFDKVRFCIKRNVICEWELFFGTRFWS